MIIIELEPHFVFNYFILCNCMLQEYSTSYTTLQYHGIFLFRRLLSFFLVVGMEGPLLIIMKAFYWKKKKTVITHHHFWYVTKQTMLLLLNSLCWQALYPFIFPISYTHGLGDHLLTENNVVILHLWCDILHGMLFFVPIVFSVDVCDLSGKYVSLVVQLKWHHHIEIKISPSHLVAFVAWKY